MCRQGAGNKGWTPVQGNKQLTQDDLSIKQNQGTMAFFEIRQYKIRPGKMDAWLDLMHTEIVPFQVSQGMVFCGSYRGEEDDSVYFWIRRFEDEAQREKLYKDVYQSDRWVNELADRVGEVMDRDGMVVHRVVATALSPMQ